MKYMTAFSAPRGHVILEEGIESEAVAHECREAALAFLHGVSAGWDKIDLVLWLTGDYARATRHVPRGERVATIDEDEVIEAQVLDELLVRGRTQLLACFEQAALDGTLACASDALERGHVRRATTADGGMIYVPADFSRMRLGDRLRALVAADYLNRPEEYLTVYVCHRCETVVFDERAKRLGYCVNHQGHERRSGMLRRSPHETTRVQGQ